MNEIQEDKKLEIFSKEFKKWLKRESRLSEKVKKFLRKELMIIVIATIGWIFSYHLEFILMFLNEQASSLASGIQLVCAALILTSVFIILTQILVRWAASPPYFASRKQRRKEKPSNA